MNLDVSISTCGPAVEPSDGGKADHGSVVCTQGEGGDVGGEAILLGELLHASSETVSYTHLTLPTKRIV